MKKKHFVWLALGTLFWGGALALFSALFFPENNLAELLLKFIVLTALVILLVQYYIGGFEITSPKVFFLLPLICWVIMIVWGSFETPDVGTWWRNILK